MGKLPRSGFVQQKLVKAGDNGDNPTETEPTKNADYVPVT
jgi:hypothetical protein